MDGVCEERVVTTPHPSPPPPPSISQGKIYEKMVCCYHWTSVGITFSVTYSQNTHLLTNNPSFSDCVGVCVCVCIYK